MSLAQSDIFLRLPKRFEAARLQSDLAQLQSLHFTRHPGRHHTGGWSGVALVGFAGRSHEVAGGDSFRFRPTRALLHCTYIREILDDFSCMKRAVRVMVLPPGERILVHRDEVGFGFGLIRLHIPIETNANVDFHIDGERCIMQPGELWYGDFFRPHWVENHGDRPRAHLVMDLCLSEQLLEMFPQDFLARRQRESLIRLRHPTRLESVYQQSAPWLARLLPERQPPRPSVPSPINDHRIVLQHTALRLGMRMHELAQKLEILSGSVESKTELLENRISRCEQQLETLLSKPRPFNETCIKDRLGVLPLRIPCRSHFWGPCAASQLRCPRPKDGSE